MRRIARRAVAIGALACAQGCFGGSVSPDYYTLSAVSAAVPEKALATRPELGLAIGPIEFPRYLDRPEMVTRDGSHRLVLWNMKRWGGSLRTDILRTMAVDLGTLLGTSRLAVYPVEARFPVGYRVLLEITLFDALPGKAVTLHGRWTVAGGSDGQAIVVEEVRIEEPVASAAWEDLVAAQRRVLGRMNREIANRIAALPGR